MQEEGKSTEKQQESSARETFISNENEKSTNIMSKPNVTRNNVLKRGILRDIGGNRITTNNDGLKNQAVKPVSRLPIFKGHLTKNKSISIKPKQNVMKENTRSIEVKEAEPTTITSVINKTKTLQIDKTYVINKSPGIKNIDKDDDRNPFLLSAYAMDIFDYLRSLEKSHLIQEDYLKGREITPKVRAVLIDWLVEVQQEYHLLQETLHITVGILDTYLQKMEHMDRKHMQLVGIASLFLASKYEEITVPAVEDLVYISAATFKESDLYEMEREIFRTIGFDISRPISLSFLRRYSKAAMARSDQHTHAKYFLELALVEYSLCHIKPSLIAAAALCLALFVTSDQNKTASSLWTKTLHYYSSYTFNDFKDIFKKLAKVVVNARNQKHQAVVQKYSSSKFFRVSTQKCLQSECIKALAISV
ncbi:hypothetical protein V9T40_008417 [Parthenolecanium corni]|uniref:Uncharacterized protein n=1 Tax=Parthenolecanium corni TaxID=536013 RepID=A0AAN9TQD7_9HEMI